MDIIPISAARRESLGQTSLLVHVFVNALFMGWECMMHYLLTRLCLWDLGKGKCLNLLISLSLEACRLGWFSCTFIGLQIVRHKFVWIVWLHWKVKRNGVTKFTSESHHSALNPLMCPFGTFIQNNIERGFEVHQLQVQGQVYQVTNNCWWKCEPGVNRAHRGNNVGNPPVPFPCGNSQPKSHVKSCACSEKRGYHATFQPVELHTIGMPDRPGPLSARLDDKLFLGKERRRECSRGKGGSWREGKFQYDVYRGRKWEVAKKEAYFR